MLRQLCPKPILLIGSLTLLLAGVLPGALQPASTQTPPSLAVLLKECTDKATAGDSSAAFTAVLNLDEALGKAPLPEIKEVLPAIMQAVDDKNPAVRTLALSSIVAIESRSNPDHTPRGDALPLLEPEIPRIAAHLADDAMNIRSATATVLGGFGAKAPDSVFDPLIAYLKREDAVTSVGSGVVFQLVRLGPQRPAVSAAIITFIDRPDQTADCLTNSIDAIAHAQVQNETIDAAIVHHLDAHSPVVRTAVIRALPEFQLPEELFTSTQARLRTIAASDQEDPVVRAAANSILPCWNNDRQKPCPVFTLPAPTPPSTARAVERHLDLE